MDMDESCTWHTKEMLAWWMYSLGFSTTVKTVTIKTRSKQDMQREGFPGRNESQHIFGDIHKNSFLDSAPSLRFSWGDKWSSSIQIRHSLVWKGGVGEWRRGESSGFSSKVAKLLLQQRFPENPRRSSGWSNNSLPAYKAYYWKSLVLEYVYICMFHAMFIRKHLIYPILMCICISDGKSPAGFDFSQD